MNYEVKIFNVKEFINFLYRDGFLIKKYEKLPEQIKYFSFDNLNTIFASDEYLNTLRFILVIDSDKNILGIAKIAVFLCSNESVSCSFLSVNINNRNKGISKILIKNMLEYIKDNFDKPFSTSEYSISGYKYLRNNIITKCKELDLTMIDNVIGFDDTGKYDNEYYNLCNKSRKIYNELYKDKEYYIYS